MSNMLINPFMRSLTEMSC